METLIKNLLNNLDQDSIADPQFHWKYLKYEIRKFFIHFSKDIARNKKIERIYLENILKTLETRPDFIDNPEYTETNEKLDKIYQEKKMVLELEKNAIGTSTEKNLQNFTKLRKISCSSKSNSKHLNRLI